MAKVKKPCLSVIRPRLQGLDKKIEFPELPLFGCGALFFTFHEIINEKTSPFGKLFHDAIFLIKYYSCFNLVDERH